MSLAIAAAVIAAAIRFAFYDRAERRPQDYIAVVILAFAIGLALRG